MSADTEGRVIDLMAALKASLAQGGATKSQVRHNAEQDPAYCPWCLRCRSLVRMEIVEPFLWRCTCGAIHDERGAPR